MWTFGILCLLTIGLVTSGPVDYQTETTELPQPSDQQYKRQVEYIPVLNTFDLEDDGSDAENAEVENIVNEDNPKSEEGQNVGQEKEIPKEENSSEGISEAAKPTKPSFWESIITWAPSFSWQPSADWLPAFSWPSFELPNLSLPSFLGGRAYVVYPKSSYNYPKSTYYYPKSSYYYPKSRNHYPKSSYYYPKSDYYYPKSSYYYPKSDYYYPKSSYYYPKSGYNYPKSSYYYPKSDYNYPKSSYYYPKSDYYYPTSSDYYPKSSYYRYAKYPYYGIPSKYRYILVE